MKILKITLVATTDFHTTGNIQGSTIDYLKNDKGRSYIPGTHIKGVMRSEAERIMRSVMNYKPNIVQLDKSLSEEEKKRILTQEEMDVRENSPDVYNIFGRIHKDNLSGYHEGKIRITDFVANDDVTAVSRMHVSIRRDSLSKKTHYLFTSKAVPAGVGYTGYIIIRNLNEQDTKLLMASLHSMVHYGLGSERSRGLGSFEIELLEEISYEKFIEGGALF